MHRHEYRDCAGLLHSLTPQCISCFIGGEDALPSKQHLPLAPPGAEQWAVSDCPDPVGAFLMSLNAFTLFLAVTELPLFFLFRTVGSLCPLKQMRMGASLWMGTCCVSSVTPSVRKQHAEELGGSIPSRPLHSVLLPSLQLSYPLPDKADCYQWRLCQHSFSLM